LTWRTTPAKPLPISNFILSSVIEFCAMSQNFCGNDALLLGSLLYSCLDMQFEWAMFSTCSKPVHKWLLVSFACVISLRVTHVLGSRAAAAQSGDTAAGEFLLDVRQKGAVPQAMLAFTWLAALPFFAFLTMVGTAWLREVIRETPECMPSQGHLWFAGVWLLVSYLCLSFYSVLGIVAFNRERRVRRAEGDLREVEDDDVRQRWGQVGRIAGYGDLAGAESSSEAGGLTPSEIKCLPCEIQSEETTPRHECSICLMDVDVGDTVRCLPACGHVFHRACIDLWLLQRADCPLCKGPVLSSKNVQWV